MNVSGLILMLICGFLIAVYLVLFPRLRIPGHKQPHVLIANALTQCAAMMIGIGRGFLYNNPDDPDVLVPKRYGLGMTVNFGHPLGRLFLIVLLVVPVMLGILGVLFPGLIHSIGCHPSGCSPFP